MSSGERERRGVGSRGKSLDKLLRKQAETLGYFEELLDKRYDEMFEIRSISLKPPSEDRAEWFAVVRASAEGVPLVGFHSGATIAETLVGLVNRIDNRSMKWRDDEYA